jgi:hypothetical protein
MVVVVVVDVVVVVVVVVVVFAVDTDCCAKKLRRGMCVDGLGARELSIMDSVYVDYGNPIISTPSHLIDTFLSLTRPAPNLLSKSASCN